jgi:hypothetical protein
MMRILAGFAVLSFVLSAHAKSPDYFEVDKAGTVATWLLDQGPEKDKNCQAQVGELNTFLSAVHAEHDASLERLLSSIRKAKGLKKSQLSAAASCEKTCACGAWQDVFEGMATAKMKLSKAEQAANEAVAKKAKETTAAQLSTCGQSLTNLCSSPIFKTLRKSADEKN